MIIIDSYTREYINEKGDIVSRCIDSLKVIGRLPIVNPIKMKLTTLLKRTRIDGQTKETLSKKEMKLKVLRNKINMEKQLVKQFQITIKKLELHPEKDKVLGMDYNTASVNLALSNFKFNLYIRELNELEQNIVDTNQLWYRL